MIEAIRAELAARANPAKAEGMRAYMKSAMPFLGVRVPAVRSLVRATARGQHRPIPSRVFSAIAATAREGPMP